MIESIICACGCGLSFPPGRQGRKFHSSKCRDKINDQAYRDKWMDIKYMVIQVQLGKRTMRSLRSFIKNKNHLKRAMKMLGENPNIRRL